MVDKMFLRMVANLILTTDHSLQEPSGTLFSEEKLESVMYLGYMYIMLTWQHDRTGLSYLTLSPVQDPSLTAGKSFQQFEMCFILSFTKSPNI